MTYFREQHESLQETGQKRKKPPATGVNQVAGGLVGYRPKYQRVPWTLVRPYSTLAGKQPVAPNSSFEFYQALVEEPDEFLAAGRLLELTDSLGFDLTDTLASHFENVAHFLQGVAVAVAQAVAKLDNLAFAVA